MELTIDSDVRVQWEGMGVVFAFTPPHNYMTNEIVPEDDPRCDMPAFMVANPEKLHPILRWADTNEVGLNVIVDY